MTNALKLDNRFKVVFNLPVWGSGKNLPKAGQILTLQVRRAGPLPSYCLSYWLGKCLNVSPCSRADVCRCWIAAFQFKILRMVLRGFFGLKNLTMLQAPDCSAQTRSIKTHSLNAPEIQKTKVWKITRLKNSNKAFLAKIVAFFQLFPNMMESGPDVRPDATKGTADWLSQWCQDLMLDLIHIYGGSYRGRI